MRKYLIFFTYEEIWPPGYCRKVEIKHQHQGFFPPPFSGHDNVSNQCRPLFKVKHRLRL